MGGNNHTLDWSKQFDFWKLNFVYFSSFKMEDILLQFPRVSNLWISWSNGFDLWDANITNEALTLEIFSLSDHLSGFASLQGQAWDILLCLVSYVRWKRMLLFSSVLGMAWVFLAQMRRVLHSTWPEYFYYLGNKFSTSSNVPIDLGFSQGLFSPHWPEHYLKHCQR